VSWETYKLSELCLKITDGSHNPPESVPHSDYLMLSSKNIFNDEINLDNPRYLSKEMFEKENKRTEISVGDVLLTIVGTIGRVAVVPDDISKFTLQRSVAVLKPKMNIITPRFLMYTLQSMLDVLSAGARGVAQKGIYLKQLADLQINVPSLVKQKEIVAIFDKARRIQKKREQAIKLADNFLRATFIEMFGDPVMNPKGFETRLLSDFFIDEKNGTKCGPFGSALKKDEYTREGVPVWNMDNITLQGDFIDLPSLWISEYKYQTLESYSVLDGDVIISRAGTVGKMGVVRSSTEKSIISTNLIRVRFGEKLYPEYFVSLMTYCKGRVGNLKTGPDGTFTHMNTGVLSNLEFPYPPLELQKKYIKIRQSVMLIIDKYHHFEFEIDDTFCAINQKAFLYQP